LDHRLDANLCEDVVLWEVVAIIIRLAVDVTPDVSAKYVGLEPNPVEHAVGLQPGAPTDAHLSIPSNVTERNR
jgi:hypothetical protein